MISTKSYEKWLKDRINALNKEIVNCCGKNISCEECNARAITADTLQEAFTRFQKFKADAKVLGEIK